MNSKQHMYKASRLYTGMLAVMMSVSIAVHAAEVNYSVDHLSPRWSAAMTQNALLNQSASQFNGQLVPSHDFSQLVNTQVMPVRHWGNPPAQLNRPRRSKTPEYMNYEQDYDSYLQRRFALPGRTATYPYAAGYGVVDPAITAYPYTFQSPYTYPGVVSPHAAGAWPYAHPYSGVPYVTPGIMPGVYAPW